MFKDNEILKELAEIKRLVAALHVPNGVSVKRKPSKNRKPRDGRTVYECVLDAMPMGVAVTTHQLAELAKDDTGAKIKFKSVSPALCVLKQRKKVIHVDRNTYKRVA